MKGVRVTECGDPGVLKYVDDLAHPGKPGGKQLLVRVKSAGVNPVDTYIRSGKFSPGRFPYVPGCDGAGVVEEVGKLVTKFKKGDRVYWGISNSGSYAELVLVPEKTTFHLSERLSFAQGAAIGVPYSTAYRALVFKAHLTPGQTVLVHGASGAVGLACCQIARALDAYVIGTAGTDDGLRLVLANGANLAFNHRQNGYADKIKGCGKTVDVIVEMLANSNLNQDFELIGQSGQIVVVGSRGRIEIDPLLTIFKEISIHGMTLDGNSEEEWEKTGQFFAAGQERGWLNPVVGREFALSEADKAHSEVIEHKGGSHGKIVLNVI